MTNLQHHAIVSDALLASFHKWGSRHAIFKRMYKKVPESAFIIVKHGFNEMHAYTPSAFNLWWVKNHARYTKRGVTLSNGRTKPQTTAIVIRQEHKQKLEQLVYQFLTDYVRGKLDRKNPADQIRSAEASSGA